MLLIIRTLFELEDSDVFVLKQLADRGICLGWGVGLPFEVVENIVCRFVSIQTYLYFRNGNPLTPIDAQKHKLLLVFSVEAKLYDNVITRVCTATHPRLVPINLNDPGACFCIAAVKPFDDVL